MPLLFAAISLTGSVCFFRLAMRQIAPEIVTLEQVQTDPEPATKGETRWAVSAARDQAIGFTTCLVLSVTFLFLGLDMVDLALTRWRRHDEDRLLAKLLAAALADEGGRPQGDPASNPEK